MDSKKDANVKNKNKNKNKNKHLLSYD